MLNQSYFASREQAEAYLSQHKILAIITEYTVFKLEADINAVVFRCLQNQYTFEVPYQKIEETLHTQRRDFTEAFLATVITYCALEANEQGSIAYPVCVFEQIDDLLDWFLAWQHYSEEERLDYLAKLPNSIEVE